MPNADAFESRLSVVEHDVAQLRERIARTDTVAGAAHVLAAGADREISEVRAEWRAHLQVLHALRETQLEHSARFDGLEREMREGFAVLGTGMAQITALLTEIKASGA